MDITPEIAAKAKALTICVLLAAATVVLGIAFGGSL